MQKTSWPKLPREYTIRSFPEARDFRVFDSLTGATEIVSKSVTVTFAGRSYRWDNDINGLLPTNIFPAVPSSTSVPTPTVDVSGTIALLKQAITKLGGNN